MLDGFILSMTSLMKMFIKYCDIIMLYFFDVSVTPH